MSNVLVQDAFLLLLLVGFSIPLGRYIDRVMSGHRVFLSRVISPLENGIYRLMGIPSDEEMSARKYALSALLFSLIGLIIVFLLMLLQGRLLNPEGLPGTSWHLAFNTAASFVSNTNWQAYSGENTSGKSRKIISRVFGKHFSVQVKGTPAFLR